MKAGMLFKAGSLWIGVHYSGFNRRLCINLIPCVTFWITFKDGNVPQRNHDDQVTLWQM